MDILTLKDTIQTHLSTKYLDDVVGHFVTCGN